MIWLLNEDSLITKRLGWKWSRFGGRWQSSVRMSFGFSWACLFLWLWVHCFTFLSSIFFVKKKKGRCNTYPEGLMWGLNEIVCAKFLTWSLINSSYFLLTAQRHCKLTEEGRRRSAGKWRQPGPPWGKQQRCTREKQREKKQAGVRKKSYLLHEANMKPKLLYSDANEEVCETNLKVWLLRISDFWKVPFYL